MDVLSAADRARLMASIGSRNTRPEMVIRSFLHRNGFRYALHCKRLPGSPDIALVRHKIAIFVNGCFWHGHRGCRYASLPQTNKEFWRDKVTANIGRDKRAHEKLRASGWHVIVVWTCGLKSSKRTQETLASLLAQIQMLTSGA